VAKALISLRTNSKKIVKLKVNLIKIKSINKFKDIIKLWFGLINAIEGLIEEVSKFKNQFRSKLQEIKVQESK
jgi:hypothetical protein